MTKPPQKALIYCRVSSKKQIREGKGLDSQEHRCRVYAAQHGFEVEKVFTDGVSGQGNVMDDKFMNRKGMVALIDYLEANPDTNYAIVFDDLKRLARDALMHLTLRMTLDRYNATPYCLNYNFDESPEGKFMELLFAGQGELEAQQQARQTRQKMKARMERGYWVLPIPKHYAYKYIEAEGGGHVLVKNEPFASIVKEALEGFASGRFQTKTEVARFLESFPEYPRMKNGQVHRSHSDTLLKSVIFTAHIEYEPWGVSLRKAKHEPLISYETFLRIQERLRAGAHAPAKTNLNEDFPLRGFVQCECGTPYTSCWSKGRNAKYPYYTCQTKGCEHKGKSIRREVIEGEFEDLLESMVPSEGILKAAGKMLKDIWDHRIKYADARKQSLQSQLTAKDREIQKLLDLVVEAGIPSVVKAYEEKIKKCEDEKIVICEKIASCGRPLMTFDQNYRTAMKFLANPLILWGSEQYAHKRMLLKMAFTARLTYVRNQGYRTAPIALPMRLLSDLKGKKSDFEEMVGPPGLEPGTNGL